ncbi:transmembrane protein, putative (macronuclear) [Tetrahymena thermophila SB210]|uniref:Transmembrane protein, putative n=1 Tax=Tetrahymena thermophila (strain SB210) TaxID=312017 RepID=W7XG55_TETTS|nr:transmembrane protein, putative [Tetrahymena thermophila SB210]EWS73076.1 transmembrane protein, putative [Tetrahymena thermophila SB210]|eukprot:XP_012654385.1 transmembrane protein, putative [Tetrahymena thermophila SB210]
MNNGIIQFTIYLLIYYIFVALKQTQHQRLILISQNLYFLLTKINNKQKITFHLTDKLRYTQNKLIIRVFKKYEYAVFKLEIFHQLISKYNRKIDINIIQTYELRLISKIQINFILQIII